jgi:hypothetical protein
MSGLVEFNQKICPKHGLVKMREPKSVQIAAPFTRSRFIAFLQEIKIILTAKYVATE